MPERITEKPEALIQAWLRLCPESPEPLEVTLVKHTPRSIVWRLSGIGPGGTGIVAKRCPRSNADLESFIYSEILGPLPMDSLRCYGFIEDETGYGWLFLEDGGTDAVTCKDKFFPAAFAHWLGTLHASTSSLAEAGRLLDRGPAWYLEVLRTARLGLCQSLLKENLADEDLQVVESILVCFDELENNWHRVEEWCDGLPWTLVHGDLQPKNVMIRRTLCGVSFLPLDWEEAGWGPPAVDLARIDVAAYWAAVRGKWPRVELHMVEQQARCGLMFQLLAAVDWDTVRLIAGSRHKALRRLRIYAPRLSTSTRALGLEV